MIFELRKPIAGKDIKLKKVVTDQTEGVFPDFRVNVYVEVLEKPESPDSNDADVIPADAVKGHNHPITKNLKSIFFVASMPKSLSIC